MSLEAEPANDFCIASVFNEGLINNLFIGICILDSTKHIRFWNIGAENITGYKVEEVIGQVFFNQIKLVNEENQSLLAFQSPVTISLENKVVLDERLFLLSSNGEKICLRLQATPAINEQGVVFGETIIFIKDTAYFEQKKHTEELKLLNEKKNQFLGMAAHDLRNPLNVIKGFTSLMLNLDRESFQPEHITMLEKIDKNSKRMLVMVNDLLDISAIEDGRIDLNKQDTNIMDILNLDNYYANIKARKKNIQLNLNIQSDIPVVKLDQERIVQVIENLLSNAIKFSEPHTIVTLSADFDDKNLYISVKDQGKGIPVEYLNTIFKAFETPVTPTGSEKSTGLGLFIVKKIVELHQGSIKVNSEPGKGTEFNINFPFG